MRTDVIKVECAGMQFPIEDFTKNLCKECFVVYSADYFVI